MAKRDVTLKNLKTNKIAGFDCGYIAKPSDMVGSMTPFKPVWEVQYLGDGTQGWFGSPQEAIGWIKSWYDK